MFPITRIEKVFGLVCLLFGAATLYGSLSDTEFLSSTMTSYMHATERGAGHIIYVAVGIPGLLTLAGLMILLNKKVGRMLFVCYGAWLFFYVVFDLFFRQAQIETKIFHAFWMQSAHFVFAVLGLGYVWLTKELLKDHNG